MKLKCAYTAGSFDCFHRGHVNILRQCALLGDVTVALNTDEFITAYKGRPPVIAYDDRAAVVQACRYVTTVLPQDSADLRPQLERVRPDYLVVGSDWATRDYYTQIGVSQDWLDDHRIILVYVPYTTGISTTEIRERLTA